MKTYHVMSASIGLALGASGATTAGAQRYGDHEMTTTA